MKTNTPRFTVLLCGLALSLLVVLATTERATASGITHYVNINSANPVSPYISTATAATAIQNAIDAAADDDIILVLPGTYTVSTPVQVNKGVYLISSGGSGSTFIDGNGSSRCVDVTASGARVEAFTIQHGFAPLPTLPDLQLSKAAGVDLAGGTLANCVVTANAGWSTGGVVCNGGKVEHCTVVGNTPHNPDPTDRVTGGVAVGNGGVVQDCVISDNYAVDSDAGGVRCQSGGLVERCIIANNTAEWWGGGVSCGGGVVRNCEITGNSASGRRYAGRGGGVDLRDGIVESCLIVGNQAIGGGDGFHSGGQGAGVSLGWNSSGHPVLRNCTVVNNVATDRPIQGETVPPGEGGGVDCFYGSVINCIVYFNTATVGPNFNGTVDFSYSCTTPNPGGTGNITSDPQFVNSSAQDFHLLPGSPCIDTGLNQPWMAGAVDLDGNPRILNGIVDMGAYEYQVGSIPEFTSCPNNTTVPTDAGVCSALLGFDTAASGFPVPTVTCTLNGTPINSPFNFPKGANEVTCTAINPLGQANCSFTVTVNDLENPVIQSVTPSQSVLSPPNHKMVPVTLSVSATDNCGIASTKIASVSSSEPALGTGDGKTASDWLITGDLSVQLRAERSGTGSGRVYTVTVEVTDQAGNKSHKSTTVTVPH